MSSSIASKISIKDKLDITYNILNIIVKSNKNLAGNKYSKKKDMIWFPISLSQFLCECECKIKN